jgi:hypothetical protein
MAEPEDSVELVPDPASLVERIGVLSDKLHALRNVVQGRKARPRGPQALADEVTAAHETWLEDVRPRLLSGRQLLLSPYDTSESLEGWERTHNALADKAIAAGLATPSIKVQVTHTASSTNEALELVETRLKSGLSAAFVGLLLFGAGVAVVSYLGSRRP